jgi:hypothetical protein
MLDHASNAFRTVSFFSATNINSTASQTATHFLWSTTYSGAANSSPLLTRVNGGTPLSTTVATRPTTTASHFFIGTDAFTNAQTANTWPGLVGELIIYRTALSTEQRQQVEGYLADKWGLNASIPAVIGTRPLEIVSRSFQPIDILFCKLWLDAADESTFSFSSGSNVSQWRDKSASANHASALSGTITRSNIPSTSRGSVTLTSAFMTFVNPTLLTGGSSSIFFVFSTADGITNGHPLGRASLTATENSHLNWSDNNLYEYLGFTTRATVGAVFAGNTTHIYTNIANRLARTLIFRTGTQVFISTYGSGYGTFTYRIGSRNSTQEWPFTGILYEMIIFNRTLLFSEQERVEGYLAHKWGLTPSLPATHSFKRISPMIPVFVPTQLPNCLLWFDAADTSTITGTSPVTAWKSKGTLASITAANAVGTCTSGSTVNGLNFVRCPAGTSLRFTAQLNTQTRSWFFVSRLNTPLSSGVFMGIVNQIGQSGQDSVAGGFVNATTNNIGMGPSGIAANVLMNVPAATMASVYMGSLVNSGTLALNRGTVNGTVQTLTATRGASSFDTASRIYEIGTSRYTTSVDIMEVLFYQGDLTLFQRQHVEGYLAHKWGLVGNLPETHPYKKFRP